MVRRSSGPPLPPHGPWSRMPPPVVVGLWGLGFCLSFWVWGLGLKIKS